MLVVSWMIVFVYVWTNMEVYVLFTLAFVFREDLKYQDHRNCSCFYVFKSSI
jgi:hypothetical protein